MTMMSFVGPLGLLFSLPLSAVLVRVLSQARNTLLSDTRVNERDVFTMSFDSLPPGLTGLTYHGKAADTWAVGVTLYCMILGHYPFLGETLQDTYEKIVNSPLVLPDDMNPRLKNLLEGLLCKEPNMRLTLEAVAEHTWVIGEDGPIPQHLCWCKRKSLQREKSDGSNDDTQITPTD